LQGSFAGLTYTAGTSIKVSAYLTAYNDSKIATGQKIMAYSSGTTNYLAITLPSAVDATSGAVTATDSILPSDASAIDAKIDDGLPTTGLVKATKAATSLSTFFTTSDSACLAGSSANAYNNTATSGACSISFTLQS